MYRAFAEFAVNLFGDPETAHRLALAILKVTGVRPISDIVRMFTRVHNPSLKTHVFNVDFDNPVGLAGGFDKEGDALHGISALGFGFVEAGTVTRFPQEGNPRPRLFRLPEDLALINRMGFNNKGADSLKEKLLESRKVSIPVGISVGKSKVTELAKAKDDYLYSFKALYELGDYFVVNVSSPNTPGLRKLQDKEHLMEIIGALCEYRKSQVTHKPILVKIAPDLTFEAIDEVLEVIEHHCIEGIIATNTTLERKWITSKIDEAGGLSGRPLKEKSTEIIRYIYRKNPELPIIGVGGVFTADDVFEKMAAGARLVQIYTSFIYNGPLSVYRINRDLVKLLKARGFKNIASVVGTKAK